MAQIVFNIPDGVLQRVIDGVAYANGYQDVLAVDEDGVETPNPQNKATFAKQQIRSYIKDCVRKHEARVAKLEAIRAAEESVDKDVEIT